MLVDDAEEMLIFLEQAFHAQRLRTMWMMLTLHMRVPSKPVANQFKSQDRTMIQTNAQASLVPPK